MKSFFLCMSAVCLLTGCSSVDPQEFWKKDSPVSGAAAENGKNNVADSPYYKALDFYEKSPSKTLILLPKFKTIQQSTEYTSGASCVKMVLDYYGVKSPSERQLAGELDIRTEACLHFNGGIGPMPSDVEKILEKYGCKILPRQEFREYTDFTAFVSKQLKSGNPILMENITWGGQWRVLIGYDDMGTPAASDDVLVFAESYDTTDHLQNGYAIQSAARFFYEWFDAGVLNGSIMEEVYVAPLRP